MSKVARGLALALLAASIGCGKKSVEATGAAGASSNEEATLAIASIRRVWPIHCSFAAAAIAWSTCHDETKGYPQVLACAELLAASARQAQTTLVAAPPAAKGECAKAIDARVRKFVNANAKYAGDIAAWLKANGPKLEARMRTATFPDACADNKCPGKPTPDDYVGSVLDLDDLSCTQTLFQCGGADNACLINHVADRLGLPCGHDKAAPNDLTVRSTGQGVR